MHGDVETPSIAAPQPPSPPKAKTKPRTVADMEPGSRCGMAGGSTCCSTAGGHRVLVIRDHRGVAIFAQIDLGAIDRYVPTSERFGAFAVATMTGPRLRISRHARILRDPKGGINPLTGPLLQSYGAYVGTDVILAVSQI